jgi:transcriptional regulator with XRE-family HTH domain
MIPEGTGAHVGRRIREIRSWRGITMRALAEQANISESHLSRIERGERTIETRRLLEAICAALRVAPSELAGTPWRADPVGSETHASVVGIEAALECTELGDDPGVPIREWPAVASDITRLVDLMHVSADYLAQGELVPKLLLELHAVYARQPEHRRGALLGLIHCYSSVCWVTKRLGGRGLPLLAARLAQRCADELASPEWRGYTTWLRGDAAGHLSRPLQYERSVAMADELTPALDGPEVMQAYGMLHLSAALAAAAQADRDTAETHLAEASTIADRMDVEVGGFGRLWFGRPNVGIWKTSLATEFGEVGKVAEIARGVNIEVIPSPSRRAEFFMDVGRAQLREPGSRDAGLGTLLRAEQLAPQRVRADVFTREIVADQLRRARRDAGGRELRGLAYRMGIAG